MTKIRKLLLLLIIILLMISFSLAISYAYYQHSATNNPSQVVATIGGGDLALENETQITLMGDRSSPISDKKALSSTLYKMTFEVSNNTSDGLGFDVALVPLSSTTMSIASVKYAAYSTSETKPEEGSFLDENQVTLGADIQSEINAMYSQSPTTGYIILNDEYLFAGTSKTYNLYVWVDYGEDGVNNSQMNKTFEGIVAITDSVVYNRQGLYALLNQQKANILTLPKLSTTIGSPIIVLSKNQGIDVNNVTNIYSVDLHKARPDYQNTNMAFFADVDDEDVIATWTEGNNFFIGERNQVRPGPSMQSAFSTANFYYHECNLVRVELFNFNTSKVTNMKNMFSYTGNNSNEFTLNLGKHFNTSNVTDMSYMFCATGNYSSSFTLDLGKHFNTSKATNMTLMFDGTGRHSSSFTLDLGFHFNTSKVTTMYRMFSNFCEKCQTLNLDLGLHFNTSRVSDMHAMFENAGNLATNFTLNLNSFVINNSAVNISNLGLNSGASTIIIGGGWGNANSTQLDNNFFLLKKPTLVYANSTFHSYRIGNKTMWDRWKGTGNTTFILNLP